jgi:hypothetical protein
MSGLPKKHINRRPAPVLLRAMRYSNATVFYQHVMIRRRHVNASWLDRVSVFRINGSQRPDAAHDVGQYPILSGAYVTNVEVAIKLSFTARKRLQ